MNNENLSLKKAIIQRARELMWMLENCGDIDFCNEITSAVSFNDNLDELEEQIEALIEEHECECEDDD